MINSIMGSPLISNVASNVTIGQYSNGRANSTSNFDRSFDNSTSPNISNISSQSPNKTSRENSMATGDSTSASSDYVNPSVMNASLDEEEDLKAVVRYLVGKMNHNEKILIDVAKENRQLSDDIKELYRLNDALTAENVSLMESLALLEEKGQQFALNSEIEQLKKDLLVGKNTICKEIEEDMESLRCSVDVMGRKTDEVLTNVAVISDDVQDMGEAIENMKLRNQEEKDEIFLAMSQDFDRIDALLQKTDDHPPTALYTHVDLTDEVQILRRDLKETQTRAFHNHMLIEKLNEEQSDVTDQIMTKIIQLEKDITTTNQYNRRPNLIIDGIPDKVPQKNLEGVCLDLIQKLGIFNVTCFEVEGCHRLRKGENDSCAPTIIRFTNRKIPELCKKYRWKLNKLRYNGWNLSFREDLCEANKTVFTECEKMMNDGQLSRVYTHNGFVKVVRFEGERPKKLSHMDDINSLF